MPTAAYGALIVGYRRGRRSCLGIYLQDRYGPDFFRHDVRKIRDHHQRTGRYSTVRIEWLYDRAKN